jgi:hypothetical protein
MARRIASSTTAQAVILKGVAVLSLLGCVLGIVAIAVVDWTILQFRNDMLAANGTVPADILARETEMMLLLNVGVVVAIGINLAGIRLMLRDRPKNRTTDKA